VEVDMNLYVLLAQFRCWLRGLVPDGYETLDQFLATVKTNGCGQVTVAKGYAQQSLSESESGLSDHLCLWVDVWAKCPDGRTFFHRFLFLDRDQWAEDRPDLSELRERIDIAAERVAAIVASAIPGIMIYHDDKEWFGYSSPVPA
jgi:hypothetical protein